MGKFDDLLRRVLTKDGATPPKEPTPPKGVPAVEKRAEAAEGIEIGLGVKVDVKNQRITFPKDGLLNMGIPAFGRLTCSEDGAAISYTNKPDVKLDISASIVPGKRDFLITLTYHYPGSTPREFNATTYGELYDGLEDFHRTGVALAAHERSSAPAAEAPSVENERDRTTAIVRPQPPERRRAAPLPPRDFKRELENGIAKGDIDFLSALVLPNRDAAANLAAAAKKLGKKDERFLMAKLLAVAAQSADRATAQRVVKREFAASRLGSPELLGLYHGQVSEELDTLLINPSYGVDAWRFGRAHKPEAVAEALGLPREAAAEELEIDIEEEAPASQDTPAAVPAAEPGAPAWAAPEAAAQWKKAITPPGGTVAVPAPARERESDGEALRRRLQRDQRAGEAIVARRGRVITPEPGLPAVASLSERLRQKQARRGFATPEPTPIPGGRKAELARLWAAGKIEEALQKYGTGPRAIARELERYAVLEMDEQKYFEEGTPRYRALVNFLMRIDLTDELQALRNRLIRLIAEQKNLIWHDDHFSPAPVVAPKRITPQPGAAGARPVGTGAGGPPVLGQGAGRIITPAAFAPTTPKGEQTIPGPRSVEEYTALLADYAQTKATIADFETLLAVPAEANKIRDAIFPSGGSEWDGWNKVVDLMYLALNARNLNLALQFAEVYPENNEALRTDNYSSLASGLFGHDLISTDDDEGAIRDFVARTFSNRALHDRLAKAIIARQPEAKKREQQKELDGQWRDALDVFTGANGVTEDFDEFIRLTHGPAFTKQAVRGDPELKTYLEEKLRGLADPTFSKGRARTIEELIAALPDEAEFEEKSMDAPDTRPNWNEVIEDPLKMDEEIRHGTFDTMDDAGWQTLQRTLVDRFPDPEQASERLTQCISDSIMAGKFLLAMRFADMPPGGQVGLRFDQWEYLANELVRLGIVSTSDRAKSPETFLGALPDATPVALKETLGTYLPDFVGNHILSDEERAAHQELLENVLREPDLMKAEMREPTSTFFEHLTDTDWESLRDLIFAPDPVHPDLEEVSHLKLCPFIIEAVEYNNIAVAARFAELYPPGRNDIREHQWDFLAEQLFHYFAKPSDPAAEMPAILAQLPDPELQNMLTASLAKIYTTTFGPRDAAAVPGQAKPDAGKEALNGRAESPEEKLPHVWLDDWNDLMDLFLAEADTDQFPTKLVARAHKLGATSDHMELIANVREAVEARLGAERAKAFESFLPSHAQIQAELEEEFGDTPITEPNRKRPALPEQPKLETNPQQARALVARGYRNVKEGTTSPAEFATVILNLPETSRLQAIDFLLTEFAAQNRDGKAKIQKILAHTFVRSRRLLLRLVLANNPRFPTELKLTTIANVIGVIQRDDKGKFVNSFVEAIAKKDPALAEQIIERAVKTKAPEHYSAAKKLLPPTAAASGDAFDALVDEYDQRQRAEKERLAEQKAAELKKLLDRPGELLDALKSGGDSAIVHQAALRALFGDGGAEANARGSVAVYNLMSEAVHRGELGFARDLTTLFPPNAPHVFDSNISYLIDIVTKLPEWNDTDARATYTEFLAPLLSKMSPDSAPAAARALQAARAKKTTSPGPTPDNPGAPDVGPKKFDARALLADIIDNGLHKDALLADLFPAPAEFENGFKNLRALIDGALTQSNFDLAYELATIFPPGNAEKGDENLLYVMEKILQDTKK